MSDPTNRDVCPVEACGAPKPMEHEVCAACWRRLRYDEVQQYYTLKRRLSRARNKTHDHQAALRAFSAYVQELTVLVRQRVLLGR